MPTMTRNVAKEAAAYVRTLENNLRSRYDKAQCPITKSAGELFALKNILGRQSNDIPASFENYCQLAQNAGFIPKTIAQEILRDQYTKLCENVKSYVRTRAATGNLIVETNIYNKIMQTEQFFKESPEVGHLLHGSMLRSHCESIAESMGNVIANHAYKRANLAPERLCKEAFISWNGPPPNSTCDPLLKVSMDLKFGGKEWDLVRRSDPSKLASYNVSKVVDRKNLSTGRIPFTSEGDNEKQKKEWQLLEEKMHQQRKKEIEEKKVHVKKTQEKRKQALEVERRKQEEAENQLTERKELEAQRRQLEAERNAAKVQEKEKERRRRQEEQNNYL